MKKTTGFVLLSLFLSINWACTKSEAQRNKDASTLKTAMVGTRMMAPMSSPISIDQANRMILSYLNGIQYKVNTNETRSFICDGDALRSYLSNTNIKQFKFIIAHNMNYINDGGEGKRPQPNQNAITIVIVGVDAAHNYVTLEDGTVLDQLNPCPDQCVSDGTASNDLINL